MKLRLIKNKKTLFREEKSYTYVLRLFSHLPGCNNPAGFGTTAFLPVAGCHRASPSTTLDKSYYVFSYETDNTM